MPTEIAKMKGKEKKFFVNIKYEQLRLLHIIMILESFCFYWTYPMFKKLDN